MAARADIVIASRMMKESVNEEDAQMFKWRKWANQTFTLLANLCRNLHWRQIPFLKAVDRVCFAMAQVLAIFQHVGSPLK